MNRAVAPFLEGVAPALLTEPQHLLFEDPNFSILLRRDGQSQLVYKHAISTIMPGHPIQLFEGAEEPLGDKP